MWLNFSVAAFRARRAVFEYSTAFTILRFIVLCVASHHHTDELSQNTWNT